MNFSEFSLFLETLEKTTLRNTMTEILAKLFSEASSKDVGKMCYLLQGRVAPLFEPIELGIADKMMIRAIAKGLGIDSSQVIAEFKRQGDLGSATEKIKSQKSRLRQDYGGQAKIKNTIKNLKISEVYDALYKVADSGGDGSQERKIKLLGDLIQKADPLSSRYIVRITLAKLRLGFSDMTVLDSLSWMITKSKSLRPKIERAYNARPDLGYIAATLKEKGVDGLKHVTPKVGNPILMARAERLSTAQEIIEKIGKCAVEPKIDGFRLQGHYKKNGDFIRLFSRNLEDVTFMYPDIVEGIRRQVKNDEVIFEGEAVGYHPETGEYLPFQEIVQRKRKYDIEKKAAEVPLKLIAFDILFASGKSFIDMPYKERRKVLETLLQKGDVIIIADEKVTDNASDLQLYFDECISRGLEGIMAKKLDGVYTAGARGWLWIKLKRSYGGKLVDTIDAVIMGYDFGQGKRTGFGIGDFLIGIYDDKKDIYTTIAKIGTGLTDNEWRELKVKSQKSKIKSKPKNYDVDKMMECDVWVLPSMVVEIRADEITRSPVHTAGRILHPSKSGNAFEVKTPGYALRFPRLERFREDKKATEATTLSEIEKIYRLQRLKFQKVCRYRVVSPIVEV